jgi:hypothetical protein
MVTRLSPVAIFTGMAAAPAVLAVIAFVPLLLLEALFSFKAAPLRAVALVALVVLAPYALSAYWQFRASTLRGEIRPLAPSLLLAASGTAAGASALFWAYPVAWGLAVVPLFLLAAGYIAWRQCQLRQTARARDAA